MYRKFALTFLCLLSSFAHAQLESQLSFNGQNSDVLKAEKSVVVITPEYVDVPSTCTRQVPNGQIEVCREVTRYREECSWVPSREECRTEYNQVCQSVPRSREVCSGGGSRQECSTIPSRTVCYDRPSREICTTLPDGTPHCTTVGGGSDCQKSAVASTARPFMISLPAAGKLTTIRNVQASRRTAVRRSPGTTTAGAFRTRRMSVKWKRSIA